MMKTVLTKICLLFFMGILLNACNSGTNSATTKPNTNNQIVNIDASTLGQYAGPNQITSSSLPMNSSLKANLQSITDSCFSASSLGFDSSSSVWYMSGSFKLTNTCASSQQLNGTKVQLIGGKSSDTWSGGEFKINSFSPWLGNSPSYTSTSSNNQLTISLNNSYMLAANQSITVNFGYARNNKPLTTAGATVIVIGGVTPTPTPSPTSNIVASLDVTINSSALSNTCTTGKPCNIAVNLLNSNGSIYRNITTLTNATGSHSYFVESIPAGSYSLSATNLPNNVTIIFSPINLQFSGGQKLTATANFSITNPSNNCLTATMGTLNSAAWWLSGAFTIKNSCDTVQALNGTTIAVSSSDSSDVISSFQINSTTPYIANFASIITNTNTVLLTVNNPAASIGANGNLSVSFAYSPQGKLLKGDLIASINGATPVADAGLTVVVDSSNLLNYCSTSKPCNIPVILTNQNGSFNKTLTTITTSVGKSTFNISNMNPGTYMVTSSNLPSDLIASYTPAASLTIASGESKSMEVNYSIKPATTGLLSFNILNPQSTIFTLESIPVVISNATSTTALQTKFGQLANASLTAGSYNLTATGLAFASRGLYYKYPILNANINVNSTTNLGNISAIQESALVSNTITINGLAKGESVILVFADNKYIFNKETLIATQESSPLSSTFKFINNDIVTINVVTNNNYQSVAALTVTITPNQNYTINLTKTPSQQIVGYFETWMARATWESATYSLAMVPSYIGIIPIAFAKPDSVYSAGSYNFKGAGLDITATKDVALGAIKLAQNKGQKLFLSVGGATYPNFAAINIPALMALVKDLNLDGIDLDYEAATNGCSNLNTSNLSCPTDTQMINIINQLRTGLDQIQASTGRKMYLTAAVWSIGAYGTPSYPTNKYGPVGNKSALWVNPLKQAGSKLDMLFLMSYDAGNASTTGYRPLDALKAYKDIYAGPIYLGIEVPPEAWGGNLTTPQDAVTNANLATELGGAGTMIWALQVQGTLNGATVNSMSYLQPICQLYKLGNCTVPIPLN